MAEHVLRGRRFRGDESRGVEAILSERIDANHWRARLAPVGQARVGDRLRFGQTAESMACLLAFLDAEITALHGDEATLSFAFAGAALDEALERLSGAPNSDL